MAHTLISTPTSALPRVSATDHTTIFLHIPKTAGSTLSEIVLRQYGSKQVIWLRQPRIADSAAEFSNLPADRKRAMKFVLGHVGYGLHTLTPNRCTYVTVMRDPVERVASYYYYIMRTPVHFMHPATSKLTLKEFAASDISHKVSNGQTKYLAEMDAKDCTAETFQLAKQHLEGMAVAGLIERFDETLMLMKKALGWSMPYYVRENVTRNKPKEISPDVRDVIIKHNAYDMELYEWVKTRFEQTLAEQGFGLKCRLKTFRTLNKVYGVVQPKWRKLKRVTRPNKSGHVQLPAAAAEEPSEGQPSTASQQAA